MKNNMLILFLLAIILPASAGNYPGHWWEQLPESDRQGSWEILPHEAKPGEVILSKRNELGIFSNFGHTPFSLDGTFYASIEGLWQMMKYPDASDVKDIRNKINEYPFLRSEVAEMHGFEAKKAGAAANKISKKHGIKFVSYLRNQFDYKDMARGSDYHYFIIKRAILAKVMQNPSVRHLLIKTRGLILKPDHKQGSGKPKSYFYFNILMDIRDEI
jgi:predicted NAD-dependent protein-ADP-ribosyltransferase YbiA (DUF1768 family)